MGSLEERKWWKDGTVYQIYPASFCDSNGDGLGDIPGIISKLDYIKGLGVDIVWLSPMYESPQYDMGYDISNYEDVHKPYGTVSDMEHLITECHIRGMRLILDLVVNHTSWEHAWFKESRSSKTHPKRDWYIWRPATYDDAGNRMPPNNWRSAFCGSAWTWDEDTQEYYLHLFTPQQPDLNWENPATRQAIYDSAMRFWLDKGVDGFRVDTVNMYSKTPGLPNAPVVDPAVFPQPASALFCNGPRIHEYMREMNAVLSRYDTMTVGECPHTDPATALQYVRASDPQLSMLFQFDLVDLGRGPILAFETQQYSFADFTSTIAKLQTFTDGTDGWSTAFCENHDQGRSVTRFADDSPRWRAASAKLLAVMLATMSGTLFVYQGQEIGMINAPADWTIHDFQDVDSTNYYRNIAERTGGDKAALAAAMDGIHLMARDHARLPMQWDDTPNAGFSTSKPWMRVHDEYAQINVSSQEHDATSVLNMWRKMLRARKEHRDLFVHGTFEKLSVTGEVLEGEVDTHSEERLFFYQKTFGSRRVVVGLNFSSQSRTFPVEIIAHTRTGGVELLVSSYGEQHATDGVLQPWEGCVWKKA